MKIWSYGRQWPDSKPLAIKTRHDTHKTKAKIFQVVKAQNVDIYEKSESINPVWPQGEMSHTAVLFGHKSSLSSPDSVLSDLTFRSLY